MTAVEVRPWGLWEPVGRQLAKSRGMVLTAAKTHLGSTSALVALVAPVFSVPECLELGGSVWEGGLWRQDWYEPCEHQQAPRLCDGDACPRLGCPRRVAFVSLEPQLSL